MSGNIPSYPSASRQDYSSRPQRPSIQTSNANPHSPSSANDATWRQTPGGDGRPVLLRSHKSFPYVPAPSGYNSPHQQSPLSRTTETGYLGLKKNEDVSHPSSTESDRGKATIPLKGQVAPVSPKRGDSFTSPGAEADEPPEDVEDEAGVMMSDEAEDDTNVEGDGENTAAEKRADKRKMKRFRLTHNQTRFLMSEFSRHAHPDAAHRERLSKEIPGLSPRQVQVWFQNRRAKLKRLTSDDRERMLRSRALPEDFDMTQALHSPYTGQPTGTPTASPVTYLPYGDSHIPRPVLPEGSKREGEDDSTSSPMSMNSTFGNFYTPPGSAPVSENLSPISATSDRGHFNPLTHSQNPSPNTTTPSFRSGSFSTAFPPSAQAPRLHLQDRMGSRNRAESLGSPLKSSMSYNSNVVDYGMASQMASTSPSYEMRNVMDHPPAQSIPGSSPHLSSASHQSSQFKGFQASAMARARPMAVQVPPGLQIHEGHRASTKFVAHQHQQTFTSLQSAPLAPPPDYQTPHHTGPYMMSSYGGPYSSDHRTHNSSTLSLPLHLSQMQTSTQQANQRTDPQSCTSVRSDLGSRPPYRNPFDPGGPRQ